MACLTPPASRPRAAQDLWTSPSPRGSVELLVRLAVTVSRQHGQEPLIPRPLIGVTPAMPLGALPVRWLIGKEATAKYDLSLRRCVNGFGERVGRIAEAHLPHHI